jgi:hypothetical protein
MSGWGGNSLNKNLPESLSLPTVYQEIEIRRTLDQLRAAYKTSPL